MYLSLEQEKILDEIKDNLELLEVLGQQRGSEDEGLGYALRQ